ncbi:hypothetical protein EST38_g8569 [Candolleomyces aberdarensis]|uniref:Uncharacterized protein n=1 Tax=Candolleomyces aberdarensis TaxID=2316362 RepID=A0A4Q2DFL5_9AGAR|nr:hypothetical protein EST38_g8569 [Candolleomyces aberdarensis]
MGAWLNRQADRPDQAAHMSRPGLALTPTALAVFRSMDILVCRRQSYGRGYGSTSTSMYSTRLNSPEPQDIYLLSAPLAIDDPTHFSKYPPYAVLFGEFMKLSGAHDGLKSELAAAKGNISLLQQLLQRQPTSATSSSPLAPSTSNTHHGGNSALPVPSIYVSPEDRKEYGSPLKQKDYPNAKFWVKKDWKNHSDSYGDRGEKGPYYLEYLTDKEGKFVGKEIVKAVRALAFRLWNQWFACWVDPPTWSKKRDDAWLFFKIRMYEEFVCLRLCEGNWKVNDVGKQVFSDWSSNGLIRVSSILLFIVLLTFTIF